jgi:hypothetical protein
VLHNSPGTISLPFDNEPVRDIMHATGNMMPASEISCRRRLTYSPVRSGRILRRILGSEGFFKFDLCNRKPSAIHF